MGTLQATDAALTISIALAAGITTQSLARHLKIPGIVLLLAAGILLGPDVGPGTGGNGTATLDTGGILQGTDSPDTGDDPGTLRGVNRNPQGKEIAEKRSGFSFLISIAKTVVRSFWK